MRNRVPLLTLLDQKLAIWLAEEINPWLRGKGMRIDICWTQDPDDKGSGVPEGELLATEECDLICVTGNDHVNWLEIRRLKA